MREYERLRKKREDHARQKLGVVGVGLAKLIDEPQTTRAWQRGGSGEVFAGYRLEKHLADSDVKLLHDRRVPGHGSANIDHIAVGPGGVTVIDTKKYKGKVKVERVGGLFSPRHEILTINGRDQTKLITGVEKQINYVESTLRAAGHADVDVRGALCMTEVDGLPLFRSLNVRNSWSMGRREWLLLRDVLAHCLPRRSTRSGGISPPTSQAPDSRKPVPDPSPCCECDGCEPR